MPQDLVKNAFRSLELPLYALIHDTNIQALKTARVSHQVAIAVIEQLPKLSISPKEQRELEKANGSIQLMDSFGSGEFFVIDAGSNKAFVFSDEKHANYVDQVLQSRSDQEFLPQNTENESDSIQNQNQNEYQKQSQIQNQNQSQNDNQNQNHNQSQNDNQNQNQNQNQSQNQNQNQNDNQNQNNEQGLNQDLLLKLQIIDNILNSNDQKQSQATIKVGQGKPNKDQNVFQKMLLLELLQGKDTQALLEKMQMIQIIDEMGQTQSNNKNTH